MPVLKKVSFMAGVDLLEAGGAATATHCGVLEIGYIESGGNKIWYLILLLLLLSLLLLVWLLDASSITIRANRNAVMNSKKFLG